MDALNIGNISWVSILGAVVLLSGGTFLLRAAGPTMGRKLEKYPLIRKAVQAATYLLLIGVSVTSALGSTFEDFSPARLIGVLFAIFLAWRKAGFLWIVLAASLTTALLRLFGMP